MMDFDEWVASSPYVRRKHIHFALRAGWYAALEQQPVNVAALREEIAGAVHAAWIQGKYAHEVTDDVWAVLRRHGYIPEEGA